MKNPLFTKYRSLRRKIITLVLAFLLILNAAFLVSTLWNFKTLTNIVSHTRDEQLVAISGVSEKTIHSIIDTSLVRQNKLQADIADEMFTSLKNDVLFLRDLAEDVYSDQENLLPVPYYRPDKSKEGIAAPQVMCEEGVDLDGSEHLKTIAHLGDPMVALYNNSEALNACYIGTCDGVFMIVDEDPVSKFDENGEIMPFHTRERFWYTDTVEAGDVIFSGVEEDNYTGEKGITCSAPVYHNGEIVGVVAADLFINGMLDYIGDDYVEGSFVAIINQDGEVVFAPSGNGIFTVQSSKVSFDLRESINRDLGYFVSKALKEETGLVTVNAAGKNYYMVGSPMKTSGWTVISVVDKEMTEQPSKYMISEYNTINDSARGTYRSAFRRIAIVVISVVFLIILLAFIAAWIVSGKIVKPIEKMTEEIVDNSNSTDKYFQMSDDYRTNDEIQVLAESFDELVKKTRQYIHDITAITKEKERIGTELGIARKIQADMLPNIFPPFPARKEFDIYASMDPAKEVGGDFYDFFLIDDNHLGIVMADVSGKGVPAALFMMMSKIVIKNFALQGMLPSVILEKSNNIICQNNTEEMFVTVWMGIMEISTGKIIASNAGHEYPIIRDANGKYSVFKDKHGLVIGGMDGVKYKDYEMQLEKGGALFVYTDGVPEATNANDELFGMDRLIQGMNEDGVEDAVDLLASVRGSVDRFVGSAEQFDDLTMLCLVYNGPEATGGENTTNPADVVSPSEA